MKNVIVVIGALAIAGILAANYSQETVPCDTEKGIQFHQGSWESALALAKKENKLIFLDVYASWCGPCKALKADTFVDEKVGSFYNKNFINVAMDAEKGEGVKLAKQFNVRVYPTLLFIDADGNPVKMYKGYRNSTQLIGLGQKMLVK